MRRDLAERAGRRAQLVDDPEVALTHRLWGANNGLLRDPADAELLAERGIAYAPDYVVNAGGAILVGVDYATGSASPEDLLERVGATTLELLRVAEREGVSTAEAALRSIDARLAGALSEQRRAERAQVARYSAAGSSLSTILSSIW